MGEITPKTGSSVGATRAGGQDRQQAAEPAQGGHFRDRTVSDVVKIGKESNPVGAFRHLFQLAQNKNEEALQALNRAAQNAYLEPQCTFSALAKQVGPSLRTKNDRYNALKKLLKSEYRGRINPLRDEMNLLTGKTKGSEENSPTFSQFHEKLEEKGVANIAVIWLKKLENCNFEAKERIKIQTGLVNVLTDLNQAPISALEAIRESRTSDNNKEFLDFLKSDARLDDKIVKRLKELNTLFPKEPLTDLYEPASLLDAEGMERLKELKTLFPKEPLMEFLYPVSLLDAEGMGRLKELKTLFPNASLKELFQLVSGLGAEGIGRLITQKTLSPDKSLQELLDKIF